MRDSQTFDFRRLQELRRLLISYKSSHIKTLKDYFDDGSHTFRRKHDAKPGNISVQSTATCIASLSQVGKLEIGPWKGFDREALRALLKDCGDVSALDDEISALDKENKGPTSHLYDFAFTLQCAKLLKPPTDREIEEKLQKVEEKLRAWLRKYVQKQDFECHAFPVQLVVRALGSGNDRPIDKSKKIDAVVDQAIDTADQPLVRDWAYHQLEREIALHVAQSPAADSFHLGYALCIAARCDSSELVSPYKASVRSAALQHLFNRHKDGHWPRSHPIYGAAYCYEYELLAQLTECVPLRDPLQDYLDQLESFAIVLEHSAIRLEDGAVGWASGHRRHLPGAESWSTASVYHFAHNLDRLVAERMRRMVFERFRQPYEPPGPGDKDSLSPEKFLDCPMTVDGQQIGLRAAVTTRLLKPIAAGSRRIAEGLPTSGQAPAAIILFGPPGTSKTTLTKKMARYLGWPCLTIDPSYFLERGLEKIHAQTNELFEMLLELEQVVVLLDEFDEMVRDRNDSPEYFSRFLTTAMLPKLQAIHDNGRILFVVATNYVNKFDDAISRPGRFDAVVQVMPPTGEAKLAGWNGRLRNLIDRLPANESKVTCALKQLTFTELELAFPRLEEAADERELLSMIENYNKLCTLSKTAKGAEVTWKDACEEQASHIRLPLPPKTQ